MAPNIEHIAKAAHEANKQFCEQLGDMSQVSWDDAPENIKQSAIDGVKYLMKHPNATGKDMHINWMKFKIADGWKHGEVKDAALKTHPSIIAYEKLDHAERMKDDIFVSMVRAHLS